ncbi:MAG: acyl carrier protein [Clostridia bacterium]|nr:acyl carrier protein [Clostridia bacterium]
MVLGKVKTILSNQFDVDEAELNEDTRLDDDLGADSLDVVDLMMSLEDTFDVEIQDEDIEKIRTIGDLVTYIEDNL